VLECAATKTCVVSTRVGQSPDILTRCQLFDDAAAGAELLMRDVRERHLVATLESAYEHVQKFNSDEAIAGRLKGIYEQAQLNASPKQQGRPAAPSPARWRRVLGWRPVAAPANDRAEHQAQIVRRVARKKSFTFALWNDYRPPPYGGGNQFMIALEGALQRKGMQVVRNSGAGADAHVIQSIWFDRDRFRREREPGSVVIHRIDGPIHQRSRGRRPTGGGVVNELERPSADGRKRQRVSARGPLRGQGLGQGSQDRHIAAPCPCLRSTGPGSFSSPSRPEEGWESLRSRRESCHACGWGASRPTTSKVAFPHHQAISEKALL
jgi:hypothetical protein